MVLYLFAYIMKFYILPFDLKRKAVTSFTFNINKRTKLFNIF